MSARRLIFCAFFFLELGADGDPEKVLDEDREALIRKIINGGDVTACARSYTRLLERREELRIAVEKSAAEAADRARKEAEARQAAQLAEKQAAERAAAEQKAAAQRVIEEQRAQKREDQAYLRSLDYHAAKYCHLSVDPRERHFTGGISADWGRVASKTVIELPAQNVLQQPTNIFIYEINGERERHVVRSDYGPRLNAEVGDLIFLCYGPANGDRHLPPPWDRERLTSPLYSGRISEAPRIVSKQRWRPIHTVLNRIHDAVRSAKWPFPIEVPILVHIRIGSEVSPGRYEIETVNKVETFLIEVPQSLPRRDLFRTEKWVWLILERPRFDAELRKLVLQVADVESRYIVEAP